MTTEITTIESDSQAFELVQRQAKLLSTSTLVPKEFQGNMANCAIGLNIAKRLGADPFMVLQNIDIIHGRPSFRATFLIAMVNASGRFTPLQFRMEGEGAARSCVAWAKTKEGEIVESPEITMAMAKAEGWSTKAGSKWVTMPELMLRYRAAAFFARIYAPDITLGMHTSEEVMDMPEVRDVTPKRHELPKTNPFKGTAFESPAVDAPKEEPKDLNKHTGKVTITDIGMKEGEEGGKKWTLYMVSMQTPKAKLIASTFSKSLYEFAETRVGQSVIAEIEKTDKGWQIKSIVDEEGA